jgi:MFS family permease
MPHGVSVRVRENGSTWCKDATDDGSTSRYDTGIVGGVLTMASYESDFHYTDSTTVSAVMVSLQNVGAFLSAISIWWVNERLGRKKTITIACGIFIVGVILQVSPSGSLVAFYIGRFVAGLGLGSMTAVAPGYNAEMAPKEIRARLGSGMQWLFALGVMISYWIVYGTSKLSQSSKQWQIPVGLQVVPPTLLGLGLLTQKESVRWLIKKDRLEEAYENLKWHRADDGTLTPLVSERIVSNPPK